MVVIAKHTSGEGGILPHITAKIFKIIELRWLGKIFIGATDLTF